MTHFKQTQATIYLIFSKNIFFSVNKRESSADKLDLIIIQKKEKALYYQNDYRNVMLFYYDAIGKWLI